ncbi:type II toxin-antitoxin system VapC family toxin [Sphingobium sp. 3R8]|uniref:type II toxin-antitoxin system VapC family toxin n=1 Tax=Sphingobium sp. 3R8 TaxID=2874921 RepID=UPI001CCA4A1B|nr:type II toxin-antitoxin system VapC family toxin [Sphingobium sp. 3R8]MBZ9647148.1 type II toxin-antitoxin system VapC family toxin [Sphingobium sp. 3R8]
MIAIDTSAIMALLLNEAEADVCAAVLGSDDALIMSSGTLTETLIVALRRNYSRQAKRLIEELDIDIIALTPDSARRAADAYARWGKGVHPASLNYGDCFAYELATTRNCPLLFVGNDFAQTDVISAL